MSRVGRADSNLPGLIVGAGGHGRVVAAVWRRAEPGRALLFVDDNPALRGTEVAGLTVAGGLDEVAARFGPNTPVHVAIGDNRARLRVAERVRNTARLATVIDPSAVVMPGAELGAGILAGPLAVVHTGARVEDLVVINTAAVIEHDCVIETGATVAPGVRMAGRVRVGPGAFVATGVTLVGRVRVGAGAIVGAGATVTADVPDGQLAYGVPARVIRAVAARDWERLL